MYWIGREDITEEMKLSLGGRVGNLARKMEEEWRERSWWLPIKDGSFLISCADGGVRTTGWGHYKGRACARYSSRATLLSKLYKRSSLLEVTGTWSLEPQLAPRQ